MVIMVKWPAALQKFLKQRKKNYVYFNNTSIVDTRVVGVFNIGDGMTIPSSPLLIFGQSIYKCLYMQGASLENLT